MRHHNGAHTVILQVRAAALASAAQTAKSMFLLSICATCSTSNGPGPPAPDREPHPTVPARPPVPPHSQCCHRPNPSLQSMVPPVPKTTIFPSLATLRKLVKNTVTGSKTVRFFLSAPTGACHALNAPKLTARQQQILDLIQTAISRTRSSADTRGDCRGTGLQVSQRRRRTSPAWPARVSSNWSVALRAASGCAARPCAPSMQPAARNTACPFPAYHNSCCPWSGVWPQAHPFSRRNMWTRPIVEDSLFQHKPDYLLKVRGMSMRDVGIMDGDLLAVKLRMRRATVRSSWPAWVTMSCQAPAAHGPRH